MPITAWAVLYLAGPGGLPVFPPPNRTSKTWNTDGWQNAYGATSNRLVSMAPVVGGVAGTALPVSMDAMGNTINDSLRTYTYDATGRMVGMNAGASGAANWVNASGLRVRKQVSGVGALDELVAYDDQRRRIGTYQPDGTGGFTVKEELVYLPGSWRLVATVRGQGVGSSDGTAYPVLSDQIGTPRVVLDPTTGDRRWAWSSKEAFGHQAPNENPDGVSAGSFTFAARFPGQFFDAESGLFHNGFRDYDARVGRYVQSDPIGLGGGWNTYGYAKTSPLSQIDKFGLWVGSPNDPNGYVDQALDYMANRSPTAKSIVEAARAHPGLIAVHIAGENEARFEPTRRPSSEVLGNVFWDPLGGLAQYNACGSIDYHPPAMALIHELAHALQNREQRSIDHSIYDKSYNNKEEKRVIEEVERKIAAEMGVFMRFHHHATPYTFQSTMKSPTSQDPR